MVMTNGDQNPKPEVKCVVSSLLIGFQEISVVPAI